VTLVCFPHMRKGYLHILFARASRLGVEGAAYQDNQRPRLVHEKPAQGSVNKYADVWNSPQAGAPIMRER